MCRLTRADLRQAIMRGAWLSQTDLTDADLRGADATAAIFDRANLRGAVLDASTLMSDKWRLVRESSPTVAHAASWPVSTCAARSCRAQICARPT